MSDGREFIEVQTVPDGRLGREPTNGRAFVIHQPNTPLGNELSHIESGDC